MYPHERSLVKRLKDEKFALLAINSDETPEKLADAVKREKLTWSKMFDGGSECRQHAAEEESSADHSEMHVRSVLTVLRWSR